MQFRIRNLIRGNQTGNALSGFEEVTTPGFGPPLHNHVSQYEIFHVLKGRHRFQVGDESFVAGPGRCVLIDSKVPHTFINIDDEDGLLHFELLPSGSSEEFFMHLVSDFDSIDDMGAFFQKHGMTLLGPPLHIED